MLKQNKRMYGESIPYNVTQWIPGSKQSGLDCKDIGSADSIR